MKVSRNFQVTIPAIIRQKFPINVGDRVKIIYDEKENAVKVVPFKQQS